MVIESNDGVLSPPTVFQSASSMHHLLKLVKKKAALAPDAVYVIYQPLPGCRLIVALSAAGRLQYKLGDEGSSTWTAGRPTVFPRTKLFNVETGMVVDADDDALAASVCQDGLLRVRICAATKATAADLCLIKRCPCGEKHAKHKCSGCDTQRYCSLKCQQAHWGVHKQLCDFMPKYVDGVNVAKPINRVLAAIWKHVHEFPDSVLRTPGKIWELDRSSDDTYHIFAEVTRTDFSQMVRRACTICAAASGLPSSVGAYPEKPGDEFLRSHLSHLDGGGSVVVSSIPDMPCIVRMSLRAE